MSSFPTEMRNPRIASVTEYALVATMAGAFSVTLITTLFVFFGGDLGTVAASVTQFSKGMLL